MHVSVVARWLLLALATLMAMGFHTPAPKRSAASRGSEFQQRLLAHPLRLFAKKQSSKGDGFGAKTSSAKASPSKSSSLVNAIPADKTSLEKQWDVFTSITDLEIRPQGDPNGEEYQKFEVVDVVVRCGGSGSGKNSTAVTTATNGNNNSHKGTKWFRIGKVCAAKESDVAAALMLQKGLIFWTAVHMRRELVVAGGRSGAAALELGYTPATMYMGWVPKPTVPWKARQWIGCGWQTSGYPSKIFCQRVLAFDRIGTLLGLPISDEKRML